MSNPETEIPLSLARTYELFDVLKIPEIEEYKNNLICVLDARDRKICLENQFVDCKGATLPSGLIIPREGTWKILNHNYIVNNYDFNRIFIDKSFDKDFYNYVENKINSNELIFPNWSHDVAFCKQAQGAEVTGATFPSGIKIPIDGEWVIVRNFVIKTNNRDEIDSNFYYKNVGY